ncbi:hypothetical protein BHE74_00041846, partial [Ensete ventricosum]
FVRIRRAREINQEAVLLSLCSKTFTQKVIIFSLTYLTVKVFNFSGTKQAAHRLKIIFGLSGMKAAELHGNLTQAQRLDALEQFRKQEVDFLIATDVAARVNFAKYHNDSVLLSCDPLLETFGIDILLSKLMTIFYCLLEQGLDIVGVQTVINFACPRDYKSGKAPYQAVHTGPPADRYVDRSLSVGTTEIGRRRSIEG